MQRLNGITLCVIFVYAMPLAGTQNSERVKCVECKLLLITMLEQNDEMLIQNVTSKSKRVPEYNKFHAIKALVHSFSDTQMFV